MPGQGGNTMAGNMLNGMFGRGGSRGGMSIEGQYFPGAPQGTPENILRLREQCARGDGAACIALKSAEQGWADQQAVASWEDQKKAFMARNAYRPMGAR